LQLEIAIPSAEKRWSEGAESAQGKVAPARFSRMSFFDQSELDGPIARQAGLTG